MRLLLVGAVCLIVSSLALAGSGSGAVGGGFVKPDTGFCWGGGIVPEPPPGFCWGGGVIVGPPVDVIWPDGTIVGGITGVYSLQGGLQAAYLAAGSGAASASPRAQPAGAPARGPSSQMYIPPAAWQWVAEHPVRAR